MPTYLSKYLAKIEGNSRLLFLIDGVGAIVTAIMHGIVLVLLQDLIGIPERVLYILALIATTFATYSLLCYFLRPKNPSPFLRIIATANLLFCLATITLMIYYSRVLMPFGYIYFIIEILIVVMIIRTEFNVARALKT